MKFCMRCMAQYDDEFQICPHCGFREGTLPADSRCMEPGVILADRYIIGMPLSFDSWTVRYIGWDALTEQRVVVNEYLPTRFAVREPGRSALTVVRQEPFYQYLSMLLRRARQLAETRLPEAVCPVRESFEKNGTAYIITDCAEGQPLREFMAERAPLTMTEAERLMLPVLRALDKLHDNGFITGGFSPDDFVVTDSGALVMHGFIANCFYHITDDPAAITPGDADAYYPPERLAPSPTVRLAPENDVYSAAMLFYALLGAALPDAYRRAETYAQKHRDILPKPSAGGAKLSRSKENALINAAAPAAAIRTADMESFIRELTSDREVPVKAAAGKGFPLWAKLAIPAAAAVLIATAILVLPMLFAKGKEELPLTDQTVVPAILHLTVEQAQQELDQAGLALRIDGKTLDDSVEEGVVLSQSVEEGAMVGVNTPVGVSVSAHGGEITMPNCAGLRLERCAELLSGLGVTYTTAQAYSESVAEGCVISQSVEPFTKVTADTPLELTVSKGADPSRSNANAAPETVGDYREQPLADVMEQAAEDHTPVEITGRVCDDSLPEGTVVEQTPAAGEAPSGDEPVKVVVTTASDSAVILPDLTLMNADVVRQILDFYGVNAAFTEAYSETVAAGLVTAHDPPEDSEIRSGDTVRVTVSMGRQPAVMPDVVGSAADDAAQRLRELGIAFTLVYDADSTRPDGEILRQNVAAGAELPSSETVIITANAAQGVAIVPDLIGLDREEADRRAQEAGLHLLIFVDRDHPFTEGQVYAQGPAADTCLERGGDVVVFMTGRQELPSGEPSLRISTHAASVSVGGEFTLKVDAQNIQELSLVNYTLSDPQVAEVVHIDRDTLAMTIRGKQPGTATVTVTCGDLQQTCTVTVG